MKKELTGVRDLTVSKWRRRFGSGCYATDIDFLDYQIVEDVVVLNALFEFKSWHVTQPNQVLTRNTEAMYYLSRRAKLPFFFCWHLFIKGEPIKFRVWNVTESGLVDDYLERSQVVTPEAFRKGVLNFQLRAA